MRLITAMLALLVLVAAGCGGSSGSSGAVDPNAKESSPPGDIPDNQAFVAYSPPGAGYSVKVPEGWSRSTAGGVVSFTDKLNTVRLDERSAASAPTVASVRRSMAPKSAAVGVIRRKAGPAIRITYLANGRPDQVTGKRRVDAVERYVFFHNGREAVVTLSGPKGADNVDPWRIITDSVRWSG
jgi:hypothetical protein